MIKFIIKSYSFKTSLIITFVFIFITILSSKIFDLTWGSYSTVPIRNLDDVYKPPLEYDDFQRVNLLLVSKELVAIEGNKKFKLKDSQKNYSYYDTLKISYPDSSFDNLTKIYIQFADSKEPDSVYLVVSKSPDKTIFYKQIFYSSVTVYKLNEFSPDTSEFRIKREDLVSPALLSDNDSLINAAFKYFNDSIDRLGLAECGTNCDIFEKICNNFSIPCRIVGLQGGDAIQTGYYDYLGYPQHAVCEIYSSKHHKWYVVDPTYGFRFRHNTNNDFLNAVEISNKYSFMREYEIKQDSILFTKRTLVGRDYFKYYENVMYRVGMENKMLRRTLKVFYPQFIYFLYHYSNSYPPVKNGLYYVGAKTFMYFFILLLYINSLLFVLTKRLFSVKKPK